jgi:branched-subunit amino acid transport protein
MRLGLLLTFVGMGVATYLTRAPLLVVLARRRLPDWLTRYFAALPIALLTALALPLVLLGRDGALALRDPQVVGAVAVALLARWTGNLLVAVAGGVVLVAGLRALLG